MTDEEIQDLLDEEKRIDVDIEWSEEGNFYKFSVPVSNSQSYVLELRGTQNRSIDNFSVVLLLEKSRPIFQFHIKASHRNPPPDERHFAAEHIHIWDDQHGPAVASETGGKISANSVDEAVADVMVTLNIQHDGIYQPVPPRQLTFDD